jgi:hypothetical protein
VLETSRAGFSSLDMSVHTCTCKADP